MNNSQAVDTGYGSSRYQSYVLFALLVIYVFNAIDRVLLAILQEYIKADLKLSDFQLGLLGGPAFVVLYTLSGIPIARYAERANRVRIVSIGAAVWSAATATCGLANNFVQLGLSRIAVGIGEAACIPPSHSLITDYFPSKRRATAIAIFGLGIPIGTLTAALLGGAIAENYGWRIAFFGLGLPGVIAAIALYLTVQEPPRRGDGEGGETPKFATAISYLLSKRSLVMITIAGAFIATFGFALSQFLVSYLIRQFGLGVSSAGPLFGLIFGIGAAIGIFLGGVLSDKFGTKHPRALSWLPAICVLVSVPIYLLGFLSNSLAFAVPLMLTGAVLHFTHLPATYTVAQNVAEPRMRATSSALLMTVVTLVGYGLGPPLIGAIGDWVSQAQLAEYGIDPSTCLVPEPSDQCSAAGGYGLRVAFCISLIFLMLGSLFFWLAGRDLVEDKFE